MTRRLLWPAGSNDHCLLRELKTCKSKMDTQSKQVSEYASRMDEYDKKFEENSRKFGTLLAVSLGISYKSLD